VNDRAIHPVYVDGPLKGQDFPVSQSWQRVQAVDPEVLSCGNPDDRIDMDQAIVTYDLRTFGFHSAGKGVSLWIGCSQAGEPDAEVLADLLLSDAAKAARCD
jgi:hypothetical protein